MSRPKKDKPVDPEDDSENDETPKISPWACEIEFLQSKPSFMSAINQISINGDRVSIVRDDGSIMNFPYDSVSKVLIMHTVLKNP